MGQLTCKADKTGILTIKGKGVLPLEVIVLYLAVGAAVMGQLAGRAHETGILATVLTFATRGTCVLPMLILKKSGAFLK
jgi:hypothetical protein